jgi:hypothetical protein
VEKNTRPVSVLIRVRYGCHPRVKNRFHTRTHRIGYPTDIGTRSQIVNPNHFISGVHSVPTDGFRISACSSRTDFCSTGFSVPAWLPHISVFHPAPRAYVRSRRFFSAVAVFFVSVFGRRQVTTLGERLCVAWLPPVLLDLLAARRCATWS